MKRSLLLPFVSLLLLTACGNEPAVNSAAAPEPEEAREPQVFNLEEVVSRYDSGQVKSMRIYPDSWVKGTFQRITYFENGQVESSGHFVNDLSEGVCTKYNEQGVKTAEWKELAGHMHDTLRYWHDNGKLKQISFYQEGDKQGEERNYTPTGALESNGEYKDGLMHGTWTLYSGSNYQRSTYVNDVRNGPYVAKYTDEVFGVMFMKGQYENGLETGLWQFTDEDGNLLRTLQMDNGKPNGYEITYYPGTADIQIKAQMRNGVVHGKVEYYNNRGEVVHIDEYVNGNLKK